MRNTEQHFWDEKDVTYYKALSILIFIFPQDICVTEQEIVLQEKHVKVLLHFDYKLIA